MQGCPEQIAQDHTQVAFEDLHKGGYDNHSGQPMPMLCHLHSKHVLTAI